MLAIGPAAHGSKFPLANLLFQAQIKPIQSISRRRSVQFQRIRRGGKRALRPLREIRRAHFLPSAFLSYKRSTLSDGQHSRPLRPCLFTYAQELAGQKQASQPAGGVRGRDSERGQQKRERQGKGEEEEERALPFLVQFSVWLAVKERACGPFLLPAVKKSYIPSDFRLHHAADGMQLEQEERLRHRRRRGRQ